MLIENGRKEFCVWGIAPNESQERLLAAMPNGKPITDRATAERFKMILETKHGCRACRIQCIDGTLPDFTNTIN